MSREKKKKKKKKKTKGANTSVPAMRERERRQTREFAVRFFINRREELCEEEKRERREDVGRR